MTEPAVGASVWASGNQVCTGNMGTLMANAMKNAANDQMAIEPENPARCRARMSNVSVPLLLEYHQTMARMATSISTEPANVNRKNLMAASILRAPPHRPM